MADFSYPILRELSKSRKHQFRAPIAQRLVFRMTVIGLQLSINTLLAIKLPEPDGKTTNKTQNSTISTSHHYTQNKEGRNEQLPAFGCYGFNHWLSESVGLVTDQW